MTINGETSLSQWSLHRMYLGSGVDAVTYGCVRDPDFGKKLRKNFSKYVCGLDNPLDFPVIARQQFGFNAVEYVNTFFFDRVYDRNYFSELKRRADGEGVRNHVLLCDFEGELGAADRSAREDAVKRHMDWLVVASMLGCRAIRLNVRGQGEAGDQKSRIVDSVRIIADHADKLGLDVLVANHSDLSASEPDWLVEIIKQLDHTRVGAYVDFGNWTCDPYQGVEKLAPFARCVSAKSYSFDEQGMEVILDYPRLFEILNRYNFTGYISIEYEGLKSPEKDGIKATKKLVERMLLEYSSN